MNFPAQGAWNGQTVVLGTGEILLGPGSAVRVAVLSITGDPGKCAGGREEVGGGRSSDDDRDNTTRSERRAPASPVHCGEVEEL
jgi:hypothetical protein